MCWADRPPALSRFLPQPLGLGNWPEELAEAYLRRRRVGRALPGDALDSATLAVTADPGAQYRGFTDDERAAYALTLRDGVRASRASSSPRTSTSTGAGR